MIAIARPDVVFDSDQAVDEMALMRSAHFAQFVGNYSRFGWSHPGPSWFYALDPVYLSLGAHSWSLYVAFLTFHAVVGALVVVAVWRRGGPLLALIASCLLLVYLRAVGDEIFRVIWPPYLPLLTVVLFFILAASGAAGSTRAMVGALVVGSFAVQTHVSTLPVILSVLAVTVALRVGVAMLSRRGAETSPRSRWVLPVTLAGLFLLALMWSPVMIEELSQRPGNLTKLWWFFTTSYARHPYHEAVSAFGRMLQVYPFGVLPPRLEADFSTLPSGRVVAIAIFMSGIGGLAIAATLLRDRFLQALAVLLVVASSVTVLAMSRIVGPMFSYTFVWVTAYPLLLTIGWGALIVRTHPWTLWRGAAPRRVLEVAAAGLAIAVISLSVGRFEALQQLRSPAVEQVDPDTRPALGMVNRALATEPPQPLLVNIASHDRWEVSAGMALALTKHGWKVTVTDGWVFMFGEATRSTGTEHVELIVADPKTADWIRLQMPDLQPIGNTQNTYLFIRHRSVRR
ncbi:MAG: hypothetical protein M3Z97_07865 [Candidatus Dormibacteraeota bacterium]|nr:hypothetical protein [Candidatus Dormibacteraeota bacterium]